MPFYENMGTINRGKQQITSIGNKQYDCRPGKSTTEPIHTAISTEKFSEMSKELQVVVVDVVCG